MFSKPVEAEICPFFFDRKEGSGDLINIIGDKSSFFSHFASVWISSFSGFFFRFKSLGNTVATTTFYGGNTVNIVGIKVAISVLSSYRDLHADHQTRLTQGEESRVFDKFYRAQAAPAGGTGLGLSIARGFIQALGGDIAGWNDPQGGAVFEILLKVESMEQGVTEAE